MTFNGIMLMIGDYGIPIVVLIAIIGIRKDEGIWGNTISAINVTFAALIATNNWEGVAARFAKQLNAGLFFWDYVAIWLLFLVAYVNFDVVSRQLSHVKVKFPDVIEKIGGPVTGVILFATFFVFYSFTLHLAPTGRPRDQGQPIPVYDIVHANSYALLSAGNLAPFGTANTFKPDTVFRDQNARQEAMLHMTKTKNTVRYEGEIPPRKQ